MGPAPPGNVRVHIVRLLSEVLSARTQVCTTHPARVGERSGIGGERSVCVPRLRKRARDMEGGRLGEEGYARTVAVPQPLGLKTRHRQRRYIPRPVPSRATWPAPTCARSAHRNSGNRLMSGPFSPFPPPPPSPFSLLSSGVEQPPHREGESHPA